MDIEDHGPWIFAGDKGFGWGSTPRKSISCPIARKYGKAQSSARTARRPTSKPEDISSVAGPSESKDQFPVRARSANRRLPARGGPLPRPGNLAVENLPPQRGGSQDPIKEDCHMARINTNVAGPRPRRPTCAGSQRELQISTRTPGPRASASTAGGGTIPAGLIVSEKPCGPEDRRRHAGHRTNFASAAIQRDRPRPRGALKRGSAALAGGCFRTSSSRRPTRAPCRMRENPREPAPGELRRRVHHRGSPTPPTFLPASNLLNGFPGLRHEPVVRRRLSLRRFHIYGAEFGHPAPLRAGSSVAVTPVPLQTAQFTVSANSGVDERRDRRGPWKTAAPSPSSFIAGTRSLGDCARPSTTRATPNRRDRRPDQRAQPGLRP